MDPLEVAAVHHLARERDQLVGVGHDVVAVPADAAADVQEDALHVREHGRDLVGDRLGGVEVARVEAEEDALPDRVAQVELVAADDERLRADPEELGLDGVEVEGGVDRLREDGVEALREALARSSPVDRRVLRPVGDPDVRDAGRPRWPCRTPRRSGGTRRRAGSRTREPSGRGDSG